MQRDTHWGDANAVHMSQLFAGDTDSDKSGNPPSACSIWRWLLLIMVLPRQSTSIYAKWYQLLPFSVFKHHRALLNL